MFTNVNFLLLLNFTKLTLKISGTSFTYSYLNKYYAAFWPYGWIEYIAPFALKKWLLTRHMSVLNLFMTVLFSFGAASTVGALGFFLSQMFFAIKGTTMYDYSNRHRRGYQVVQLSTYHYCTLSHCIAMQTHILRARTLTSNSCSSRPLLLRVPVVFG